MKKLLVTLVALVTVGNAFAYKINMVNNTDGVIRVELRYGGVGVCAPDMVTIQTGAKKTLDVGLCCTDKVYITALSGTAANKRIEYAAPRTGFALSCRGFNFTVSNPVKGELNAETDK